MLRGDQQGHLRPTGETWNIAGALVERCRNTDWTLLERCRNIDRTFVEYWMTMAWLPGIPWQPVTTRINRTTGTNRTTRITWTNRTPRTKRTSPQVNPETTGEHMQMFEEVSSGTDGMWRVIGWNCSLTADGIGWSGSWMMEAGRTSTMVYNETHFLPNMHCSWLTKATGAVAHVQIMHRHMHDFIQMKNLNQNQKQVWLQGYERGKSTYAGTGRPPWLCSAPCCPPPLCWLRSRFQNSVSWSELDLQMEPEEVWLEELRLEVQKTAKISMVHLNPGDARGDWTRETWMRKTWIKKT